MSQKISVYTKDLKPAKITRYSGPGRSFLDVDVRRTDSPIEEGQAICFHEGHGSFAVYQAYVADSYEAIVVRVVGACRACATNDKRIDTECTKHEDTTRPW